MKLDTENEYWIGIMAGSSCDGLDVVCCRLDIQNGLCTYQIIEACTIDYPDAWRNKLMQSTKLTAQELIQLDIEFGKWIGHEVNNLLKEKSVHHLNWHISLHGHTVYHEPSKGYSWQIGHASPIAAITQKPVVSQLRMMDISYGGQGAPIIPIGEKMIWNNYQVFLNIGGIANLSIHGSTATIAFDVIPANAVLNYLSRQVGKSFDDKGQMAFAGTVDEHLLHTFQGLEYLKKAFPKSLNNQYAQEHIFPLLDSSKLSINDKLSTYCNFIAQQIASSLQNTQDITSKKIMITGGGAHNSYLISRIQAYCNKIGFEIFVPDAITVNFKEAITMALIGCLRNKADYNVYPDYTGATKHSINGCIFLP